MHRQHIRHEVRVHATWSWNTRGRCQWPWPATTLLRWKLLAREARRRKVFEARRPLDTHCRMALAWRSPAATRRDGNVVTLREGDIIKEAHGWWPIRSPSELLRIRPLHVGNRWVVQKGGSLLRTARGVRQHIRQVH